MPHQEEPQITNGLTSQSTTSFSVVVIGAGVVGLAAAIRLSQMGHRVQVLEKQEQLSRGGGGIGLSANSCRILEKWGIFSDVCAVADRIVAQNVRRYADGDLLLSMPRPKNRVEGTLDMHRDDCLGALYKAAIRAGAKVTFGARVSSIDEQGPIVTLEDGSVITCDILLGADGVRSQTRATILGATDPGPCPTNSCIFIVDVPFSLMEKDDSVKDLITSTTFEIWFGPGRCVVLRSMPINNSFHLQFIDFEFRSHEEGERFVEAGDIQFVRERFADFHPVFQTLLSMADATLKWRMVEMPPLPSWHSQNGKVLLIGDAAHAMVPFTGQGASQGIEDAAVYAELLAHAKSEAQLPAIAELYQKLRKTRAETVQNIARLNSKTFGFHDGPQQEARDATLRASALNAVKADVKATNNTQAMQKWIIGHDAVAEAITAAQELSLA